MASAQEPAQLETTPVTNGGDAPAKMVPVEEPEYQRKFNSRTSALEVLEGVDVTGLTVLITGTTSGIGIETARSLAIKGAHVVMANRNIVQSEELRDKIYAEYADESKRNNIDLVHLDLSSLQSVQAAAREFIAKGWPLNVLILNAGVAAPPVQTTIDGYESTFGINHLGHFYLTYLLLDRLRESAPSRVVVVASRMHSMPFIGLTPTLTTEEKLDRIIPDPNSNRFGSTHYALSKLCNVLFAFKLDRDEKQNGVRAYAVHPGNLIKTSLNRSYGVFGKILGAVTQPFTKNLQQGASTTIYCAVSPDVAEDGGKYYEACFEDEAHLNRAFAHDVNLQDALWTKSIEFVNKFEASRSAHHSPQ